MILRREQDQPLSKKMEAEFPLVEVHAANNSASKAG